MTATEAEASVFVATGCCETLGDGAVRLLDRPELPKTVEVSREAPRLGRAEWQVTRGGGERAHPLSSLLATATSMSVALSAAGSRASSLQRMFHVKRDLCPRSGEG